MDDRSEKIITLAREMLRNNVAVAPAPQVRTISLKVLCLATCLAAASSTLVTTWAIEQNRPLNRYEKTELEALIFYTSRTKGIDDGTVRKDVEAHVGVANLDDMNLAGFEAARHYLQKTAR